MTATNKTEEANLVNSTKARISLALNKEDALDWARKLKWNEQGLIPAIVQDVHSLEVLMVAYMNQESFLMSCEQGETVFWSRSRKSLWHKGATSGHTQHIEGLYTDCDQDTLLIQVTAAGPACHTGSRTCFFEPIGSQPVHKGRFEILDHLEQTIAAREQERPEGAYTTYLFEQGIDKVLKKIGEEAAEVIIAAKNNDASELKGEIGDLLFHLLVLMKQTELPLDEVLGELSRRHQAPRRDQYSEQGKIKD